MFVVSLVQCWKLHYIYIVFTQRVKDFNKPKRNMNDGTIVFLASCFSFLSDKRYVLREFILFFQLTVLISHHCFWKNVLIIIFEIIKKENNTNTSSFNIFNRCWFKKPIFIFLWWFHSVTSFWILKKNSTKLSIFLKYGLSEVKKALS